MELFWFEYRFRRSWPREVHLARFNDPTLHQSHPPLWGIVRWEMCQTKKCEVRDVTWKPTCTWRFFGMWISGYTVYKVFMRCKTWKDRVCLKGLIVSITVWYFIGCPSYLICCCSTISQFHWKTWRFFSIVPISFLPSSVSTLARSTTSKMEHSMKNKVWGNFTKRFKTNQ